MTQLTPVRGWVRVWQDGELLCEGRNKVVTDGLKLLAERIANGDSVKLPSLFKLGDSAAISTADMTNIQGTQVAEISATVSLRDNILTWSGNFVFAESSEKTCREIGLFQASGDGGRMLARFIPLQQFTLKNGTPVKINWEITIGE